VAFWQWCVLRHAALRRHTQRGLGQARKTRSFNLAIDLP
jgi:hypothetical protein